MYFECKSFMETRNENLPFTIKIPIKIKKVKSVTVKLIFKEKAISPRDGVSGIHYRKECILTRDFTSALVENGTLHPVTHKGKIPVRIPDHVSPPCMLHYLDVNSLILRWLFGYCIFPNCHVHSSIELYFLFEIKRHGWWRSNIRTKYPITFQSNYAENTKDQCRVFVSPTKGKVEGTLEVDSIESDGIVELRLMARNKSQENTLHIRNLSLTKMDIIDTRRYEFKLPLRKYHISVMPLTERIVYLKIPIPPQWNPSTKTLFYQNYFALNFDFGDGKAKELYEVEFKIKP